MKSTKRNSFVIRRKCFLSTLSLLAFFMISLQINIPLHTKFYDVPSLNAKKSIENVVILKEFNATWKIRDFRTQGLSTFTQYSAYRMGPTRIRILGVAPLELEEQVFHGCHWHGNDGSVIHGSLVRGVDTQSPQFMAAKMFDCYLDNVTGDYGGKLYATLDTDESIFFREDPGQPQEAISPFKHYATYCSAPMHGELDARMIYEWIEYHRVLMNADKFVFYNIDSVDNDILRMFKPYMDKHMLEIVEFSDVIQFKLWYYGQVLASWDCVAKAALESRWIFLHDLDEYLHVVYPHTLQSILKMYDRKSWLTHGMFSWNISLCNNKTLHSDNVGANPNTDVAIDDSDEQNKPFAIERMEFFRPRIYCLKEIPPELCLNNWGHRKLIVNPRAVDVFQTHQVMDPDVNGVHLNASTEMRHHHYRELVLKSSRNIRCIFTYDDNINVRHYHRSTFMASRARIARSCPLNATSFQCRASSTTIS